jgi:hypothetical protein
MTVSTEFDDFLAAYVEQVLVPALKPGDIAILGKNARMQLRGLGRQSYPWSCPASDFQDSGSIAAIARP